MQVILLENIRRLGKIGDNVEVKGGYARNFLLPREKALRATEANVALFEKKKAEIEAKNNEKKAAAEELAKKVHDVKINLICQASEDGRLYGSVNTRDIAASIAKEGIEITHKELELQAPIKFLGIYEVRVELHSEVVETIKVNVARTKSEAEEQWKLGKSAVQAKLDEAEKAKAAAEEKALNKGQKPASKDGAEGETEEGQEAVAESAQEEQSEAEAPAEETTAEEPKEEAEEDKKSA